MGYYHPMAITELFSPLGYSKGRAWKLKSFQTHGLLTLRKRRTNTPRPEPIPSDDIGPCRYLAASQAALGRIALAWKTGSGYGNPFLELVPHTVNYAAWAAFAAANDYIHPDGRTSKRTAWQWFAATNRAGFSAQFAWHRTYDPAATFAYCSSPAPSVPHADLTITACTFGTTSWGALSAIPTPFLLTTTDPWPHIGDSYLNLSCQVPRRYTRHGHATASYGVSTGDLAIQDGGDPTWIKTWYRFVNNFCFMAGTPARLRIALQYLQTTDYTPTMYGTFPTFGTLGPRFEATVDITPDSFS